jgi:hypothetical protein
MPVVRLSVEGIGLDVLQALKPDQREPVPSPGPSKGWLRTKTLPNTKVNWSGRRQPCGKRNR